MSTYRCIGVMSGTSLDGLDICCAEFTGDVSSDVWSHRVLTGVTYRYTDAWSERLRMAPSLCGEDLVRLHIDYGHLVGCSVRRFIDESRLDGFNVVASHGHTVFHQPQEKLTFQLGDGETIASYVRFTHTHEEDWSFAVLKYWFRLRIKNLKGSDQITRYATRITFMPTGHRFYLPH